MPCEWKFVHMKKTWMGNRRKTWTYLLANARKITRHLKYNWEPTTKSIKKHSNRSKLCHVSQSIQENLVSQTVQKISDTFINNLSTFQTVTYLRGLLYCFHGIMDWFSRKLNRHRHFYTLRSPTWGDQSQRLKVRPLIKDSTSNWTEKAIGFWKFSIKSHSKKTRLSAENSPLVSKDQGLRNSFNF